jgi:hypothetical protein
MDLIEERGGVKLPGILETTKSVWGDQKKLYVNGEIGGSLLSIIF